MAKDSFANWEIRKGGSGSSKIYRVFRYTTRYGSVLRKQFNTKAKAQAYVRAQKRK